MIGLNEVVSGGEQESIRREFEKVIYKSGHWASTHSSVRIDRSLPQNGG